MTINLVYEDYMDALCAGDRRRALDVAQLAVVTGSDIRDLYSYVFQPAMYEIGRLWEGGQCSIAEEHMATAITEHVMAQLHYYLTPIPPLGRTMVAACVAGEQHALGLRMVADFFEMEGWTVAYLGANVPTDPIVQMITDRKAELLAISVTLPCHVPEARALIAAVRASPGGAQIKVLVGGQPFIAAPETYHEIGADFTARNPREAVALIMQGS